MSAQHDWLYDATLVRVVDGDTVDLEVDLGFRISARIRCRLKGVDCPERGQPKWDLARDRVHALLAGRRFLVGTELDAKDKYGRVLATIWPMGEERSVNRILVDEDLGQAIDAVGLVTTAANGSWLRIA